MYPPPKTVCFETESFLFGFKITVLRCLVLPFQPENTVTVFTCNILSYILLFNIVFSKRVLCVCILGVQRATNVPRTVGGREAEI